MPDPDWNRSEEKVPLEADTEGSEAIDHKCKPCEEKQAIKTKRAISGEELGTPERAINN